MVKDNIFLQNVPSILEIGKSCVIVEYHVKRERYKHKLLSYPCYYSLTLQILEKRENQCCHKMELLINAPIEIRDITLFHQC